MKARPKAKPRTASSLLRRVFFLGQCVVLMPLLWALLHVRLRGPRLKRETGRGLILAPNHSSWLDGFLVQLAAYPHRITFLVTEIFHDLPVLKTYFRTIGARPIREGGPSVSALRTAQEALERGEIVCLFPEGEITRTGELGRGRRGVARLARRTGAPVLPIGIRGAMEVYSRVQPRPRLGTVEIRLGEPLRYEESADREGEERFTMRLIGRIRELAYGSSPCSARSRRTRQAR